jgi:hypothetical protein
MKKITASIVLIFSIALIAFSFNVVFLEEAPGHKYPAISNIEHSLVDANESIINLKTEEVRVLHKFSEERYLSEWRSKFAIIIFSLLSGVLSILVLIESKKTNE